MSSPSKPDKEKHIGDGIFITVPPDTAAVIWEAVRAAGYAENGDGVLSLLLDYISGDNGEPEAKASVGDLLAEYLEKNPEQARKIALAAKLAGHAILKKFRG